MTDRTRDNLPKGERWSAFDTFSWITFGEVREASIDYEFRKEDWSRNWEHWPPEYLHFALSELATGIPCLPDPADMAPFRPDTQRVWASRIVERTAEPADRLLEALLADIERYHTAQDRWKSAKASVNQAAREGRLRVWGIKAFGPAKPDKSAIHELLNPWLFDGPRGVNEAGWIDWLSDDLSFLDDRGPWYDEVRFDSAEVRAIWPPRTASKEALTSRACEWMTQSGDAYLLEKGEKPFQKTLLPDCIAAFKAEKVTLGVREGLSAYRQLPDRIRRSQGETKP